jgi:hypothetical protein
MDGAIGIAISTIDQRFSIIDQRFNWLIGIVVASWISTIVTVLFITRGDNDKDHAALRRPL